MKDSNDNKVSQPNNDAGNKGQNFSNIPPQNSNRNLKILVGILVFLLIVGISVAGFYIFGNKVVLENQQPEQTNNQSVLPTTKTPVTEHINAANNIFITNGFGYENGSYHDNNIYQTDNKGKNRIKITNYPAPQGSNVMPNLNNVQIIDDNYLGYYRCDVKVGNFNCSVFRVNKTTKNSENIITANENDLIGKLAFFDIDTFVYSVSHTEKDSEKLAKGKIVLFKNGKESILKEVDYGKYFGLKSGEGVEADISNLSFSPDGTKILAYIGPGPAGGNGDTFIFDLNGNEIGRISHASEAQWNNNNTIIFSLTDGLYLFDLATKKEVKFLSGDIQNPKLLRDSQKIVYWVGNGKGEVWLYDMQTKQNDKLLFDASHPLWISSNEVMASNNNKSVESDEARTNGFTQSMIIYNTSSKEEYKLFDISEIKEGWIEFLSPLKDQGSHSFFYSSNN